MSNRGKYNKNKSPALPSISVPQQVKALTDQNNALAEQNELLRRQVETLQQVFSTLEGMPAELKEKVTLMGQDNPVATGNSTFSSTEMGLKMLANDNHRHKWCVIIHGIPGPAGEEVDDTLAVIQRFGQEKLHLHKTPFSAIHRLSRNKDASIIARFSFLGDKDKWLRAASQPTKETRCR